MDLIIERVRRQLKRIYRWLPVLMGAMVLATTWMIWNSMVTLEQTQVRQAIKLAATSVRDEMNLHIGAQIQLVTRMVKRWENWGAPPQARWEAVAALDLEDTPGYQALVWVDPTLQMRWVKWSSHVDPASTKEFKFGEKQWQALLAAREHRTVSVSPISHLPHEGKGFFAGVPIFRDEKCEGFIVGIFESQTLLDAVLVDLESLGYSVAVFDGADEIYSHYRTDRPAQERWAHETKLDLHGLHWRVRVWPEPELLTRFKKPVTQPVLIGGHLVACLLAVSVWLAQTAHSRARQMEVVNRELLTQIAHRERTETALEQQARELARSNTALEQYASIAAHDLQEPLRKVMTFSERLKSQCGPNLDSQSQHYLSRMENSVHRMQVLVRDLLVLSQTKTQPAAFLDVDLNEVVHAVLSDLEVRIQQTQARVEVGELPVIQADRLQMQQLLQNLLSNALKFSRPNVPPVVQISCARVESVSGDPEFFRFENGYCQITVQDNGIGFDEKYLDIIFAPFERLHSRDNYEGTGMGLAICQTIVDRHGGTITARSAPDQGTTFIVTLPLKHTQEESV